MAKVLFYTATAAQFAQLETKNENALYFLTDTGEFYKGSTRFSFPVKLVASFPATGEIGVLYIQNGTYAIKIWTGEAWAEINTASETKVQQPCTSYAVFPTDFDIPAGAITEMDQVIQDKLAEVYGDWVLAESLAVAIPAQMTYKFNLSTMQQADECDVVVDWGDGTQSIVKNGDYERVAEQSRGNRNIVLSHTYQTSGKYKVQILGKDYYAVRHQITMGFSGSDKDYNGTYNLVCDALNVGYELASHIQNGSSLFIYSNRLLKINAPYLYPLRNITNCTSMFFGCENLIIAKYLIPHESPSTYIHEMFCYCRNLRETDFVIPCLFNAGKSGMDNVFNECHNLEFDIKNVISGPFIQTEIFANTTFRECYKMTGTVPAEYLWKDNRIKWKFAVSNDSQGSNQCGPFYGCSAEIRAQVPLLWGGTNTDEVPAESIQDTVKALESDMSWGELA